MEIVKWVAMIVGIVILLLGSIMIFIRSAEKKNANKKAHQQQMKDLQDTNDQLDEVIQQLEDSNVLVEKVSSIFTKINENLFDK